MFSGGLDSTYLAWRLLTNNDDPAGGFPLENNIVI